MSDTNMAQAVNIEASRGEQASSKRPYENIDTSPNSLSLSPPSARHRLDAATQDFANMFLDMILNDTRVIHALSEMLTVPLLVKLDERENTIASLIERVKVLENTTETLKLDLKTAQDKNDELEQYGRRNSLRVWTPAPEILNENTDRLICDLAKGVGVTILPQEICRSHRVGRRYTGRDNNQKPRPIIVKFISYATKKKLYAARKGLKDAFISEDLTKTRNTILYRARQQRATGRFLHTWTDDGLIKVRLKSNNKVLSVTTLAQLERIIEESKCITQV